MKYYIIATTIKDGEFEYYSQSPYMAETEQGAREIAAKDASDWVNDTYRDYEINGTVEITEAEYKIIAKYIH